MSNPNLPALPPPSVDPSALLHVAENAVVHSPEGAQAAVNVYRGVQELHAEIKAQIQPHVDKAKAAYDSIRQFRDGHLGRLDKAMEVLREKLSKYAADESAPMPTKVQRRRKWSIRIVDPALVPQRFLMPNQDAILTEVKAWDGNVNIPGVEVYKEMGLTIMKEG